MDDVDAFHMPGQGLYGVACFHPREHIADAGVDTLSEGHVPLRG